MKVLVIYGGEGLTTEHEVSKKSGSAVALACVEAGFHTEEFIVDKDNIETIKDKVPDFDVVFPVLHGKLGEDGEIQKILDETGISYVGSGVLASQLCWDKGVYKYRLEENKILTPKWRIIKSMDEIGENDIPCVVKPVADGSSIGIELVSDRSPATLKAVSQLFETYERLMLEEYIEGREITVGVLGDKSLPVVEIIPPEGKWFDYENKYSGVTQELCPPQSTPIGLQDRAQNIALEIHSLMGCRHISRTDMIVREDKVYVLETNTMPGMTENSLYPKAAAAIGLDMPALVRKLVKLAYES